MIKFKIKKKDKEGLMRLGVIKTHHGDIQTPNFVPVATKGALKGAEFEKISSYGADIFMMNTYHLFCNGRFETIGKAGGLHNFLNIKNPIMTDSGGFQVFSLGLGNEHGIGKFISIFPGEETNSRPKGDNLAKIDEKGVSFKSHINGEILRLDPKTSMSVQKKLGADIIFAFDECTSPLSDYEYTKEAMERTHRWAKESLQAFNRNNKNKKQSLYGIVQGGEYRELREVSAKFISSLDFNGFGIGGFLGKTKDDMKELLGHINSILPENKPRHLLGIAEPEDIFIGVEKGIDTFDCVIPTRLARHGIAYTSKGKISLKKSKNLYDKNPLDPKCKCNVCKKFSRQYICHLVREKEIYGSMLLTEHNLAWYLSLMKKIRESIKKENFDKLKKDFFKDYKY